MKALDMGAVDKLIVFENLTTKRYSSIPRKGRLSWSKTVPFFRYVLRNPNTEEEDVVMLTPAQEKLQESFKAPDGTGLETVSKVDLVEWLAEHFKEFGCNLEFITDRSQEGAQVRDPTTWTIFQQDGPSHLGLW